MAQRVNSKRVREVAIHWANSSQRILDGWIGDASSGLAASDFVIDNDDDAQPAKSLAPARIIPRTQ